jgi:tripartite-type tricarboxylate transporter receptor subunit TctC
MNAKSVSRHAVRSLLALGLGPTLLVGCSGQSSSDASDTTDTSACSALAGETVSFVVPYGPGGGFDVYARMIAPFLEEELDATVVVENMEGAGGLLAIRDLLTEDPDGTRFAIMNGAGVAAATLAEAQGSAIPLDDLTYLGAVVSDPSMLFTNGAGPYQSWEGILEADGFQFGSSGTGSLDFIHAHVLTEVFDLDAEVVTGFTGSSEQQPALLSGDIDAMLSEPVGPRAEIESGSLTPILSAGSSTPDWLSDVPTLSEMKVNEDQQGIIDAHIAVQDMERPFVAPPGMDEELRDCLRNVVASVMKSPDLIAMAEDQQRPLGFRTGEEMDATVDEVLAAPEEYKELLRPLF